MVIHIIFTMVLNGPSKKSIFVIYHSRAIIKWCLVDNYPTLLEQKEKPMDFVQ